MYTYTHIHIYAYTHIHIYTYTHSIRPLYKDIVYTSWCVCVCVILVQGPC